MNIFFAKHWYERYQYLTQCSPGHPFVQKLKNKEVKFTDPEKLIEYFETSEEAVYLWSDSEDFAIIADMYKVRIKIITTEGVNDKNPTVNWIYPEKSSREIC